MRLFVALALPDAIRAQLADLREPVEGVRWSPPEQFHVTMRFLGEVADTHFDTMETRLAAVRVEPFVLPIEGVGVFPAKGPPRTVWAGVGRGHPRLHQLRQKIDDALIGAGLEFDVRTFHPHVTLGRVEAESGGGAVSTVRAWAARNQGFVAAPFLVDGFGLYSSVLHADGAEHALKRWFSYRV